MNRFATGSIFAFLSLLIFASPGFGQPDSIYRVPAGTRIRLKLDVEINSKVSSVGDTFLAVVAEPVKIRDVVAIPVGALIEGRVTEVSRAGSGGHSGAIKTKFETLKLSNESRRIDGEMITDIRPESNRTLKLVGIFGGVIAGTAIGAASGSLNGALIGAGIGGGAGTAIGLLSKGKDLRIRQGEVFEIELKKEVLLPVLDN